MSIKKNWHSQKERFRPQTPTQIILRKYFIQHQDSLTLYVKFLRLELYAKNKSFKIDESHAKGLNRTEQI